MTIKTPPEIFVQIVMEKINKHTKCIYNLRLLPLHILPGYHPRKERKTLTMVHLLAAKATFGVPVVKLLSNTYRNTEVQLIRTL